MFLSQVLQDLSFSSFPLPRFRDNSFSNHLQLPATLTRNLTQGQVRDRGDVHPAIISLNNKARAPHGKPWILALCSGSHSEQAFINFRLIVPYTGFQVRTLDIPSLASHMFHQFRRQGSNMGVWKGCKCWNSGALPSAQEEGHTLVLRTVNSHSWNPGFFDRSYFSSSFWAFRMLIADY